MDDIITRAIAEDEIGKRDFDRWQYQRQRQQQEQQEREQKQEQHRREQRNVRAWLAQSAGDEVRTTDFFDERNEAGNNAAQQPHPQQFMNDQQQAHWDAWCKAMARAEAVKAAVEMNDLIVDDLDKVHDELNARFDRRKAHFEQRDNDLVGRIAELETRLVELEARVADLEGSGEQQKVVPLLTFRGKGGRDAA
jgi:hypothetical protein